MGVPTTDSPEPWFSTFKRYHNLGRGEAILKLINLIWRLSEVDSLTSFVCLVRQGDEAKQTVCFSLRNSEKCTLVP
jgi:hypothetical protein